MKILIVDDEHYSLKLLERYIGNLTTGSQVTLANNGVEAIEKFKSSHYDLAFIDIEMPELNGLELAKEIQTNYSNTFVIFVTAHSNYALEAFKVDAIDYITKPILKEDVNSALKKFEKYQLVSNSNILVTAAYNCMGFGDFFISSATTSASKWPTHKCKELMAYICYSNNQQGISKWKLYDLLWPDGDDQKNNLNLRSTAHRLNKALEDYGIDLKVKSNKNTYTVVGDNLITDLDLLQQMIQSPTPTQDHLIHDQIAFLESCYRGDFLDFIDNDWRIDMESFANRLRLNATERFVKEAIAQGYTSQIQALLQLSINAHPYTEVLHHLMVETIEQLQGKTEATVYRKKIVNLFQSDLSCEPQWIK